MRLPRRLTTLAAVGCLALTAAGCGGGADPAPKSTTSPSKSKPAESRVATTNSAQTSAKASETDLGSTDPGLPKPARSTYRHINEKSEAGASDALSYFIEGYRYSLITRDPSIIEEMAGPDCNACREMIADIRNEPRKFSKIDWTIKDRFIEFESDTVAPAAFTIQSRATPLDPKSRPIVETIYIGGKMTWLNGRWVVNNGSVELEDD